MATLVIKGPDGAEREQDFGGSLSIGRADGNDLVLLEGGVSRKHARFFVEGGEVVVEDVGSQNGTWVDGERIDGPTPLTPKSQVVIGEYELSVKAPRPRASAGRGPGKGAGGPTPKGGDGGPGNGIPRGTKVVPAVKRSGNSALVKRPRPSGSATGPILRGLSGVVTGKSFPLSGTMLVGRVSGVDLQIDDDSVSRRHAEVEVDGREVLIRDLGSANGTSVNGAPIDEDTPLASGDIVQFGVVELMFETVSSAGARAPVVRTPGRPDRASPAGGRRPVRRAADEEFEHAPTDLRDTPPPASGRTKLLVAAGAVVLLLFAVVAAKAFTSPSGAVADPSRPPVGKKPVKVKDPAEQIEELLAACRTYSATDTGNPPDWVRADEACQKVLEIEPIHVEANQLLKRIQVERACQENLQRATELVLQNRGEESLEFFARVKPDCPAYFLRALAGSRAPVEEVKKLAGGECKTYAAAGRWEEALKRCEVYSRLACQTMRVDEVYPPAMTTLKLDGPLGKNDWRPKDTLYMNFLRARARLKPGEPIWQCPDIAAFRPPPPPPDPAREAKEEFRRRYPDPGMGEALVLYFEGKMNEAPVPLQKIYENTNKAQLHEAARALQRDISDVINFFRNGLTEVTNGRPERAEEPFRKALALDEKLVLGDKASLPEDARKKELERRTSFFRKTIVDSMATNCYQKGKDFADRKDYRAACRIWKLGFGFSRANNDLLKAVQFCSSTKASRAFESADSCELLKSVLDYAVDGDGFKEQVEVKMTELGCN